MKSLLKLVTGESPAAHWLARREVELQKRRYDYVVRPIGGKGLGYWRGQYQRGRAPGVGGVSKQ